MSVRRAPAGLSTPGRNLWRDVTGRYELNPNEDRMLLAACRTADELERLEKALADAPATVAGSKGQIRPHPLFAEVRAHRLTFKQLLAAVGIEEGESGRLTGIGPIERRPSARPQAMGEAWRGLDDENRPRTTNAPSAGPSLSTRSAAPTAPTSRALREMRSTR